ncbi:MAG: HAMP domain-containing histidine kinase [Candidatus Schekmanbacteria bacterium]|nr:HAMP domain-containing histidine kinase [Candidatus Schekmanbacteria bacterium]
MLAQVEEQERAAFLRGQARGMGALAHRLSALVEDLREDLGELTASGAEAPAAQATARLADLIRTINAAVRADEMGRRLLEPREPVSLAWLVGDLIRALDREWRRRGITLTIEAHPETPCVHGPLGPLEEAVSALLLNAGDAAGQGGTVHVAVAPEAGAWVSLRVADSGPGFSPQRAGKAALAFVSSKGDPHPGLGLFLAEMVATTLGGCLILGNGNGGGGLATMRLPAAEISE